MKGFVNVLFVFLSVAIFAQKPAHLVKPSDTLNKEAFINTVDQSLMLFYQDYASKQEYDSIIKLLNYESTDLPKFTDEEYCARLEEMNKMSPFHLDCNQATLSTIKFFVDKRRGFIRIAMGRSDLYFDMFEEKLAEYGLPKELKFLAVIESGLRPQVKSRAGALGLWQFMYRTGLYFGLKENSYIDERMDPALATDAACRYFRQLYGIYGDWNLVLAAYNAGPGNVNKAIRRSGNKTNYWEVRPFLPSETQGYVPNFIAAAYLMTYHAEHNIIPVEAKVHNAQLDTMCLSLGVHMATITSLINWPTEEIKELNPIYKTSYVPQTVPAQCITGPLDRIGLLVGLEDSLYKLEKSIYSGTTVVKPVVVVDVPAEGDTVAIDTNENSTEPYFYHVVKTGETMNAIATKYLVTVEQLMEWNALRTTNIYAGQRLKVKGANKSVPPPPVVPAKKYYSVRSGDTFSKIADRNRMSQAELRRLNPKININRLTVGQKIRIR
ncbi:MAG: LysM peptidoglycan-binding domain-containing protein [Crocinitomicaceae bacterium]|nr:LysM peptidoglycan-binding domain-containing protein [Crocinitomicaceae bacterium]MCF8433714.1 LysM peptidoglycan-binding domain-containing protein [Crocinitomicaceae bacterium]